MAALAPQIRNKEFQNWLKGALALLFTKQGLDDFVNVEITQFQKDVLASVFSNKSIPTGTVCNSCTTENVLPCPTANFCFNGRNCKKHNFRLCPNNICQDISKEIRQEHSFNKPFWKNTDASGWCKDPFQIAKCYMPEGYFAAPTLACTDFNGTLSVIINNKRFDRKMDTLDVCIEARDVGREIRHSADMTLTDAALTTCIDILIDLLSDKMYLARDSKAKEAVDKLKQLKAHTLTITTTDITTVLDDRLKAVVSRQLGNASHELNTARDETQKKFLNDVKGSLVTMQTVTMNNLDKIVTTKINEFETTAEKAKRELAKISAKGRRQIREEVLRGKGQALGDVAETILKQNELEQFMRVDLINFYRKYHSIMPVSPIVEEHDATLSEFYVQPPLSSVDIQKFGRTQNSPTKKTLQSLRDIFVHSNGQLYKDIYITAKAGIGKTSFVKRIAMLWCQAHNGSEELEQKCKPEDIQMMKTFEFLFTVSLRDIDASVCKIDDMIKCQIISFLGRYILYNDRFLANTLQDRKCLVILDGLDEWCHPRSCEYGCRTEQGLPQRPVREKCTIMTTLRPWKLDVLKLSSNQMDRHVEIEELDQETSEQLISNTVTLLNKRSICEQPKNSKEFQAIVSSRMLDSVRYIPYILLQMICVWFDSESIGESLCEIYSNTLELTLSRGLMKLDKPHYGSEKRYIMDDKILPRCFLSNGLCKVHYDLILSLGELAFETLFCTKKESSFVFDETIVLKIIPEDSLQFCLKLGFLSQNKDWRQIARRRRNISFQHKSFQEYLAALYIHSYIDNVDMKRRLLSVCNTLAAILEMSNTFVFLGGFSPSACGTTLQILREVVSNDAKVVHYRNSLLIKECVLTEYMRIKEEIRAFQLMQTEIVQEIKSSGKEDFPFYVEDIIIDSTVDKTSYPYLEILIKQNKDNIKSLLVRDVQCSEEFADILKRTSIKNTKNLQKLVIIAVPPPEDLLGFLSCSENTLKCLRLSFLDYHNNLYYSIDTRLSSHTVQTISSMKQLVALMLHNIELSHSDVKVLFKTLGNLSTMKEIGLYEFKCIDHDRVCGGEILDLSQHKYLQLLDLDNIPVAELHVNTLALSECMIGEDQSSVFPPWLESLKNAGNLHSLLFRRMTPSLLNSLPITLPQLVELRIFGIEITDLGDSTPTLSSETNINSIYFYQVTMTSAALKRLAESAAELSHSVKIILEWCTVTPVEEYQKVKDYIRTSSKYTMQLDGVNWRHQLQLEFETVAKMC